MKINQNFHSTPSSTAITADIGNGNYQCSSASDDIGQYRPDIAVLPGLRTNYMTEFLDKNCAPKYKKCIIFFL